MTPTDDARSAQEDTPRSAGLPIAEAIGTKRLIAAIILMPVIAVVATLAIILYAKARPKPVAADPATTIETAPVRLPPGGRIAETVSDGRHLIVRVEGPEGGEIAVYDLATGERLRTIPVLAP